MKLILAFVAATALWAIVIVALFGLMTFSRPDLSLLREFPGFWPGCVLTSIAVRYLFRKRLSRRDIHRDWSLPFLTIAAAGPLWTILNYSVNWAGKGFSLSGYPFDGFLYAFLGSLVVGLGLGILITYPAAYLTQIMFGMTATHPDA